MTWDAKHFGMYACVCVCVSCKTRFIKFKSRSLLAISLSLSHTYFSLTLSFLIHISSGYIAFSHSLLCGFSVCVCVFYFCSLLFIFILEMCRHISFVMFLASVSICIDPLAAPRQNTRITHIVYTPYSHTHTCTRSPVNALWSRTFTDQWCNSNIYVYV